MSDPPPYLSPIPVAPLAYSAPSTPGRRARPGVITAIGVVSIVVACLSLIGSGLTAVFAFLFYVAARGLAAALALAAANPPPPVAVGPAPPPVVQAGPRGLGELQRHVAVRGLSRLRAFSPQRQEQLDVILAQAGKDIFPDGEAALTEGRVREMVLDSGELFTGNRQKAAPDYFKTEAGRLEVYDERAVFYPADGAPAVRASATPPVTGPQPLSPERVQAAVQQAQAAANHGLNPAQMQSLTAVLSAPGQRLVPAAPPAGGRPLVNSVALPPGGNATIQFVGGALALGPQGQILPPGGAPTPVAVNGPAFALAVAAALAGLGLAVLLLAAGIVTLRRSPAARRMHLVWALLKLPVTALGAFAFWWMASSFGESVAGFSASTPGAPPPPRMMWNNLPWQIVTAAAVACVYPAALLIVLRTKAVREYYGPATADG